MTAGPRRTGLRLPWVHEEDPQKPDAEAQSSSSAPLDTTVSPAETAQAPAAATAQAGEVPPASAVATNGSAMPEDNALLPQLIAAMREVAERERGASLASLQASVRGATEALTARSEAGAEELRKHADEEISGIGEWVKLETQRVATEGDRKIEARRQQLTQQLTDHEQQSQAEVARLNERFAEYERELASFFAQLNEITDPAAFGAAAKRMPRPPTLTDAVAAEAATGPTSASATSTTPAAPAVEPAAETAAETSATSPTEPPAAASTPEAAAEPKVEDAEAKMVEEHRIRLDALGLAKDEAAIEDDSPATDAQNTDASTSAESATSSTDASDASSAPDAVDGDDSLRARLAELDETIGAETAAEDAPKAAEANGSETATAIVVHGLGSFGAITSFKQALERVEGVHGISLSLGPTGEFVYRATHDAGFDLVAAIEGIESGQASIDRQPDGSLRVNVQRGR